MKILKKYIYFTLPLLFSSSTCFAADHVSQGLSLSASFVSYGSFLGSSYKVLGKVGPRIIEISKLVGTKLATPHGANAVVTLATVGWVEYIKMICINAVYGIVPFFKGGLAMLGGMFTGVSWVTVGWVVLTAAALIGLFYIAYSFYKSESYALNGYKGIGLWLLFSFPFAASYLAAKVCEGNEIPGWGCGIIMIIVFGLTMILTKEFNKFYLDDPNTFWSRLKRNVKSDYNSFKNYEYSKLNPFSANKTSKVTYFIGGLVIAAVSWGYYEYFYKKKALS